MERELIRFWRQKSRVLGVVALTVNLWAVIDSARQNGPQAFLPWNCSPHSAVFRYLFDHVHHRDRREGFLLSMLVSPASRSSLVLGKILGSATLAGFKYG